MPAHAASIETRVSEIRKWVAAAEARGVQRSQMQLNLSHRDLSGLKRSPGVLADEISFAGGLMSFLGVEVVAVNTSASSLQSRELA